MNQTKQVILFWVGASIFIIFLLLFSSVDKRNLTCPENLVIPKPVHLDQEEQSSDEIPENEFNRDEFNWDELSKDELNYNELGKENLDLDEQVKDEGNKDEHGNNELSKDEHNKDELGKDEHNKDDFNEEEFNWDELNNNDLDMDELNKDELNEDEVNEEEMKFFLEEREAVYRQRRQQVESVCQKYKNVGNLFKGNLNAIARNLFKVDGDHRLAMCENAKVRGDLITWWLRDKVPNSCSGLHEIESCLGRDVSQ